MGQVERCALLIGSSKKPLALWGWLDSLQPLSLDKRYGSIDHAPVQVRNPEARGIETVEGPFMSSDFPVAGFAIIEADDLAAAIEIVSRAPCAVAHGVVEVWPLRESLT